MASTQSTPAGPGASKDPIAALEVSVVIPCLNEAENIEECVRLSLEALAGAGLNGEVVGRRQRLG